MKFTIARIPGDGIGPEIVAQASKVLDAIGSKFDHQFAYKEVDMGAVCIKKYGEPITDAGISICKTSDAVLFGAIGDPSFDQNPNAKVRPEQGLLRLRESLELHTNIRPLIMFEQFKKDSPLKPNYLENVDLVIFRELIGGIYFGEKKSTKTSASDLCKYEDYQIKRIAIRAFEEAEKRSKKLTLVDKANVLETSRLWRKTIQKLAKDFPQVSVNYMYVDNCAMQMVINPSQFDVILTENMFGDIISDLSSVLCGSIGMLPSASIGTHTAVFEPIHGSYPEATGLNIANPMATILSVAMLLDHLKLKKEANLVRSAIDWSIRNEVVTKDINPNSYFGTNEVGDLVSEYILEDGQLEINIENLAIAENSII